LDGYLSLHHFNKTYQKTYAKVHPLVYWEVTYYKHDNGTQYVTRLNPKDGAVIGFDAVPSLLAKSSVRTSPKTYTDQELRNATSFANQQLAQMHLISPMTLTKTTISQNIFNYTFTMQSKKIGNAPMQAVVKLDAKTDRVVGFETQFSIPKVDTDWFATQSKHSDVMTWIFMAGQVLFFIIALIMLYVKRHTIRYGTAFWLMVTAFVIDWIVNLNSLPNLQSQTGFMALSNSNALKINGLLAGFVVATTILEVGMLYFITVSGGALAKEVLQDRWLSFRDPAWPQRIRSAAFRGYALAIIWLGLQTLFYYIGQTYFHVWEQNDTDSSPWNNVIPGFLPIAAWFAGINEELTFRLFGFALVKKYLKSTWLALLIPAMIWALGHSLYPVFPVYTRFIELTIFGTLIGWCMLKWDFETVVFAHVAFDAILMSLSLLSDQPVRMIPIAVFWGISPLLFGLAVGFWKPRKQEQY
jgi:hypothetical protein